MTKNVVEVKKNVVEVTELSRQFGSQIALDNISVNIAPSAVYGLVGANGAGKTTLIKHLLGLLRAKSGSVAVFGLDPVKHPAAVLARIGYLSEERELPEWMTIKELMNYTQAYYPNWDAQFADQLLDTFNLDRAKKIKDLSKGMRAQTGLVAAVAHRPELLILDEPSSGLDAVVRKDILDAIVRTVTDDERTVIFSSHLLDEVERMSDHILMMDQGRIVLDGPLEQLQQTHQCSTLHFSLALAYPPSIAGVFSIQGSGRAWEAIHTTEPRHFAALVADYGGEVVRSRNASLQEIFLARVAQDRYQQEAA